MRSGRSALSSARATAGAPTGEARSPPGGERCSVSLGSTPQTRRLSDLVCLRDSIATESVDLIYLDPPFNSNAT